ncbi:MAG: tRNA (adenosine(37)-N6)-threonylcarbamoyltransferase complex dimerization subunit type 1 TsaB [Candidatus Polarisedimenticolia bacterium]
MIALGLDTSSMSGSVALVSADGSLRAQLAVSAGLTHSERLLPGVRSLLDAAAVQLERIDLFSVAAGPGSFTGLRIGMAAAKGLALACGRPLTGFSTLEAIALACAPWAGGAPPRPVCVLMDAGRGEVYRGLYRASQGGMQALAPDAALPPEAAVAPLAQLEEPCLVCGDGLAAHRSRLAPLVPEGSVLVEGSLPIAETLARMALDVARSRGLDALPVMTPHYLRVSDAERTWRG